MRRLSVIAAALLSAVALAPAAAQSSAPSAPASGGSAVEESAAAQPAGGGTVPSGRAPKAPSSAASGGNPYGRPFRIPPLVRRFAASPLRVRAGDAATLHFRVDSPVARRVHVVMTVRRSGRRASAARTDLGRR